MSIDKKAPKPEVERVEELAQRILSADILLPKFQRDFVWSKSQVLDLWDSIANDFPIGSVLLWRSREELRSEKNIADLKIADPRDEYPVNYLLDGQQRLSSVCGALYWQGDDVNSQWNIAYDLRTQKFLRLKTLDDVPNHQVRLNWLPDAALFFKQLSRIEGEADADKLKQRGEELFNRLKDYKIAAVTLFEGTLNDVAPIFERINSKGTPLTIVDLMRAATWSDEFDLFEAIDAIRDRVDQKGFGGIDRKVILRNLSAAAGGGYSEGSIDDLRKFEASKLKSAADEVKASYELAIDFLSTELGIPSDRHIPYSNQLVVLSDVFRGENKPTASQRSAIKRWFWRTAASGYFGGWNTGNMSSDQKGVEAFVAGDAAELASSAAEPSPDVWRNQQFRLNTAHAKILALLLASLGPRDLVSGQAIDVGNALHFQNSKEFHHVFPRDFLAEAGIDRKKSNLLANIVMLTSDSNKVISNQAPSSYFRSLEDTHGSDFGEILDTNLISHDAHMSALDDNYDQFVEIRSFDIGEHVDSLI